MPDLSLAGSGYNRNVTAKCHAPSTSRVIAQHVFHHSVLCVFKNCQHTTVHVWTQLESSSQDGWPILTGRRRQSKLLFLCSLSAVTANFHHTSSSQLTKITTERSYYYFILFVAKSDGGPSPCNSFHKRNSLNVRRLHASVGQPIKLDHHFSSDMCCQIHVYETFP